MSNSSELSTLGPSTRVTGHVSGKGGLRIEGKVVGNVGVTGPAELGPGASVEGDVTAESLDLAGSLVGNVTAGGAVVVRAGSLLHGEVKGEQVAIEPGARVSIKLQMPFELNI
jgi:cytoskeletal protein CcmA (bactofilin family)